MTYEDVRRMALGWPGVEEAMSYGTPALKVKGKFLTHLKEDGDSLVIKDVDFDERDMLMEAAPQVFYITDHCKGPWCCCACPRRIPIRSRSCCCAPGKRQRLKTWSKPSKRPEA